MEEFTKKDMIELLEDNPMKFMDIVNETGLSQGQVDKILRELRKKEKVYMDSDKRYSLVWIDEKRFEPLFNGFLSIIYWTCTFKFVILARVTIFNTRQTLSGIK